MRLPGDMFSTWPLLWAAFLPCISLAYEVDWKKLDGLARAKVEVRKSVFSTVRATRLQYETETRLVT